MVEVAYIEARINDFKYKVRIPKYQLLLTSPSSISTDSLPTAYVCTTPGCRPSYNIGDMVWVGYELGNTGVPVIIGLLYRAEDGGTYMTLSDKVELPAQEVKNYENRFLAIELRSNDILNGNFICKKLDIENVNFSILNQIVRYTPLLNFKSDITIENALKELITWIFNTYTNDDNGLYYSSIIINNILGYVLSCINKTKIKRSDYTDPRIVPEYCTAHYYILNEEYIFGYNNSNWYFERKI